MSSLPALDIDLLRTFLLIAEGQSFTLAAERAGRTQSAISLQVRRLEGLIGHRLFDRRRGGRVQLTSEGRQLLGRAKAITSLNDETVAAFRQARPHPFGLPFWGRPAIAVMPFDNLGGDPGQQYFVDGFVDDLIAGLSRVKSLLVIARNSTLAMKNKAYDLREVGRTLGVRYVLTGSLRKAAGRLCISLQLVDAASCAVLWVDSLDRRLDDVLELQDDIIDGLVSQIAPGVQRAEIDRARSRRFGDLEAYDLYLQALPYAAAHMPAGTERALPLLQRALALEPDYALAHALSAWCYEWRYTRGGWAAENREAALRHAGHVLALDTDDADALAIAGFVSSLLGDEREAGLDAMGRALRLNDASAQVLYLSAHAVAIADQAELAASLSDRALRLSPLDPLSFEANMALGDVAMRAARYDDAAACFERSARINPKYSTARFFQAMAMALDGRADEALPVVRRGLKLEPDFRARIIFEVGMPPALTQHFEQGARALGLAI